MFDPLIKCLQETRTKRQWVKLLWQKAYLGRRFRSQDVTTKRLLNKALRQRLAQMSQAEAGMYVKYNHSEKGCDMKEKLENRNKRERLMIHSILTDMHNCFIVPDYLGTA